MGEFIHLHNHSIYSILDGVARISDLVNKAKEYGMRSLALTDHGNMFGIMEFVQTAKAAGIKPIIGSEIYVSPGKMEDKTKSQENYYHLVLLVKDEKGYDNLKKISSLGYTKGFYYKPRVDKDTLRRYSEGLIALSACIAGEPQRYILRGDIETAKKKIIEYKEIFGDNYYLEIQNHGLEEEKIVREAFVKLSKELNVPLVATNDIHYIDSFHAIIQDIMFATEDGKTISDKDRRTYPTNQIYFKSSDEMIELFKEYPEAIENTLKIAEECNFNEIEKDVILPRFEIPEGYESDFEYLKALVYQGLEKRYSNLTNDIIERAEYELSVIKNMGFVGYFLIVQDVINSARKNGVPVGPGRGSAAGSLVAYALGITNIDPLKYNLLFERFLNPERVSMPDIDIDFGDTKRDKVIEYVKQRYGSESIAQIVTFSIIKEKAAIRDVARFFEVTPSETDRLTKIYDSLLKDLAKKYPEKYEEYKANDDVIGFVISTEEFKEAIEDFADPEKIMKVMEYSRKYKGPIRQLSLHAAGVIIAPGKVSDYVPICTVKDVVATQYDKNYIEAAGLLKMDFLGLRTLTQIYKTLELIEENKGKKIDIENIPLDDKKTWKLFQNGDTVAVFQFESLGMRKYLKELKPNRLEDLIAMNALYRPGPMDNIPSFINRKHGREPIEYLHPKLKPILEETYGIIVYQEQVMKIAQDLAGFSLGKADLLRRAMAKKKVKEMEKLGKEFIEGAIANGIDKDVAEAIFKLMEKFASYGFNKSHAAAYAWLAYQTAYLKANYPIEYFTAILSTEKDADKIRFFIKEAKKKRIKIMPPNINISDIDFKIVDDKIYLGLAAIKNIGEANVRGIIEERNSGGPFKDFIDFVKRVPLNKNVLENLIKSGALDSLGEKREKMLANIDKVLNYASTLKKNKEMGLVSLFASGDNNQIENEEIFLELDEPENELSLKDRLSSEIDLIGFFVSGNPLDKVREEAGMIVNFKFSEEEFEFLKDKYKNSESNFIDVLCIGTVLAIKAEKRNDNINFVLRIESFEGEGEVRFKDRVYYNFVKKYYPDRLLDIKTSKRPKVIIELADLLGFYGYLRLDSDTPVIYVREIFDLRDSKNIKDIKDRFLDKVNIEIDLKNELSIQINSIINLLKDLKVDDAKFGKDVLIKLNTGDKEYTFGLGFKIQPDFRKLKAIKKVYSDVNIKYDKKDLPV